MPLSHEGKVLVKLIKRSDKIKNIADIPYWIKQTGSSPWERYTEMEHE
jgi:hypothetical protein